ncbi:bifunctional 2-polyprenyl-6-hydroxyphenol methylase/3-demethylubiquinol 3-O-methyltransferase UbiG [Marinoscillum sp. MHG1-6]|uniref:class I SAM-dependent methyltransferase n=1 Tax=Marinoscillum sp. MHG1-6 TaxID=2959627 RepID=UPI002157A28C|nr:class I SAM-dependent methyltransferase [Marinoscillum sp. MHG1-6]
MSNFNGVAFIYDRLAQFVFGREWKDIQMAPAKSIKSNARVLIVGGGSGMILERIEPGCQVDFVELSDKMLEKARRRVTSATVKYVQGDYLNWSPSGKYDAVVFPFFLDSFNAENLSLIIQKAKNELHPKGQMHIVDFRKGNVAQRFLIKLMYLFFRVTAKLEGDKLLDFDSVFTAHGFQKTRTSVFLNQWVFYSVYQLPEDSMPVMLAED